MRTTWVLALTVAVATLLFWLVVHQVSAAWLDLALRPDVREALQQSMEDQKRLRALDDGPDGRYHARFEATRALLHRLDVIRLNRSHLVRRFELALVSLFAVVAGIAAAAVWARARRTQARERKAWLERIATLQENARRHAHEIKGPLTAMRLELERAADALRNGGDDEAVRGVAGAAEQLEALARVARQQASFASIGTPLLARISLRAAVEEFCATFAGAWPQLELRFRGGDAFVCADVDMLRQVFVNLCANAAHASEGEGSVTFRVVPLGRRTALDVADTGGGIPTSLHERVFDPYVTTRKAGEGMGLGLAISRKIMLDHGGDLRLLASSPEGTTMRLLFGDSECS